MKQSYQEWKSKSTKTKSKKLQKLVLTRQSYLIKARAFPLILSLKFRQNCRYAQGKHSVIKRDIQQNIYNIKMYFEWPLIYSYPILQYVPQQSFEVYLQENRLYSNYSALDQTEIPQVLLHITEVGRSAPNLGADRNSLEIVRKQQNNQNNENSIQIKSQQGDEIKRNKNSVYPKKNAQSNLINQIFSFLSSKSKSYYILLKILKNNQTKVAFYYELMKNLKSQTKKYINRFFIKKLIQIDSDHYINTYLKNSQSPIKIQVPELRKLFRMLINYYFNNVCSNILLTSTKLNRQSRKQHLRRKRQVQSFLVYHVKLSNSKGQKNYS